MTDRELQTLRNLGHDDAADEIEKLRLALCTLLAEPFGCPFCDSGELRNRAKDHNESCGYWMAAVALGEQQ